MHHDVSLLRTSVHHFWGLFHRSYYLLQIWWSVSFSVVRDRIDIVSLSDKPQILGNNMNSQIPLTSLFLSMMLLHLTFSISLPAITLLHSCWMWAVNTACDEALVLRSSGLPLIYSAAHSGKKSWTRQQCDDPWSICLHSALYLLHCFAALFVSQKRYKLYITPRPDMTYYGYKSFQCKKCTLDTLYRHNHIAQMRCSDSMLLKDYLN